MTGRLAVLLLAVPGGVLCAQEASLFIGATHARYADSLSGSAGFASARFDIGRGLRAARGDVAYSAFTNGGWALQAGTQATVLAGRGPFFGVAWGGSVNTYRDGTLNGSVAGGPLIAVGIGQSLGSVGLALGGGRRIDSTWLGLGSAVVRWQGTVAPGIAADAGVTTTMADTLRFADLSLGLRWSRTAFQATAVAGVRVGDLADGAWGSLELGWRPTRPVGVEVSAGRYPRDIVGFAQGWYAQAGLRLHVIAPSRAQPPVAIRRIDPGRVVLTVRVRGPVAALAVAGDWNGWVAVPLRRGGDGAWSVELPLAAGVYRYALASGDGWLLPDGIRGEDDGFGGRVATLVISP